MNDNYSAASGQGIYGGRFAPSALTNLIDSMAPNTFAQLTTTNIREHVYNEHFAESYAALESDSTRVQTNWTNKYSFIQSMRRIVGVGTSEGYSGSDAGKYRAKAIIYDLETNLFTQQWNPTNRPEAHGYDGNCSIPLNGKLYRKTLGKVEIMQCDVLTGEWVLSPFNTAGISLPADVWSIDVFPELGSQGSLIGLEKFGRIHRFDIDTGLRTTLGTFDGIGTNTVTIYVNGAIIFGGGDTASGFVGNKIYKMDSLGNITLLTDNLPGVVSARSFSKFMPDPKGGDKAFYFSNDLASVYELNTITGIFSLIGAYDANLASSPNVAAISITGTKGIVMLRGRGRTLGQNMSEFWVYKTP